MFRRKKKQTEEKKEEIVRQPTEQSLFNESDKKSMEIAETFLDRLVETNSNQRTPSTVLPTGVADIDESVVLPTQQSLFVPPKQTRLIDENSLRSFESEDRSYCHHHHHHHHQHRHQHHPMCSRYRSSSQLSPGYDGSYDPRWWYMPINSVHGPRRLIRHEKHYVPPKWYELPNRN